MEKYVFSGALTDSMHDYLLNMPDFEPLDILESQINRSSIRKIIDWKKEGFCRWLFIDSGAFSVHTGKADTTQEEYAEYINSIDEYIDVFAQLDTIPGKFGKPKSDQDYIESAQKSWDNYMYMRNHVISPHKCMYVFHYGENFDVLRRVLQWKDENGEYLDYVGISPANDVAQKFKNIYLQEVADVIAASNNPDVKTHLYGMTALDAISKYPCYSADSITHRLLAGYAKIVSKKFGIISISKRDRTNKTKSNMSFLDLADEYNINQLKAECELLNLSLDLLQEDVSARVAFNIHNIQKLSKNEYVYKPTNVRRSKRLF